MGGDKKKPELLSELKACDFYLAMVVPFSYFLPYASILDEFAATPLSKFFLSLKKAEQGN